MGRAQYTPDLGDVILEAIPHKRYVRMRAVHVESGIETSVVCPITAKEEILRYVALSKLDYVMKRCRTHATKA